MYLDSRCSSGFPAVRVQTPAAAQIRRRDCAMLPQPFRSIRQ